MTPFRLAVIAMVAALGAKGADSVEIDARGGVISNVGSQTEVHIATASGTGDAITLEADRVVVKALVQKQSEVDAVVSMLQEQQLLLGEVAVLMGMRDLTVGDVVNSGSLGGIGNGSVAFNVEKSDGCLYVNSVFTNKATKTAVKKGDGQVAVNGDFHASVDQVGGVMSFAVATSSSDSMPRIGISGAGLIYDADSAGLDSEFGKDSSSVQVDVKVASISTSGTIPARGFNVNGGTRAVFNDADIYLPVAVETLAFADPDVPGCYEVGSDSAGTVTLDGGSVSAKLLIGSGSTGSGVVKIGKGASVTNICCSTNRECMIAKGGFGCLEICGGSYVAAGDWSAAADVSGGQANIVVTNGSFVHISSGIRDCGFGLAGNDGYASLYVGAKGRFDASSVKRGIAIPETSAASYVQVTAEDGGTINLGGEEVLATRKTIFNINDSGVLSAGGIGINTASGGDGAIVQFNGGVFNVTVKSDSILTGTLISYENGATINASTSCALAYPLEKPSGMGLDSIDVPETLADKVFEGAPLVIIKGEGVGATAVCELDPSTGKISGFRITGRGSGYTTWGTATVYCGKYTQTIEKDYLHWSENVSGGLTKTGNGTLVLRGANTYSGETKILGGQIQLNGKGTISQESGLSIYNNGILDLGGSAAAFSDFGGDGSGVVSNGTCTLNGLVFDMTKLIPPKEVDVLNLTTNIEFSLAAGVKLLNLRAETLDRNTEYTLCYLQGAIPDRLPPLDAEAREQLGDAWGIMIREDKESGKFRAVLRYFGGSYFIYY